MRKFRVIPITHSLRNNKIAKSNDIVDESQLSGPANDLVLAGYLEDVTEAEKAKADAAEKARLADEKAKADAEKENVNLEAKSETNAETENIEVVSETVKKEVKPKK